MSISIDSTVQSHSNSNIVNIRAVPPNLILDVIEANAEAFNPSEDYILAQLNQRIATLNAEFIEEGTLLDLRASSSQAKDAILAAVRIARSMMQEDFVIKTRNQDGQILNFKDIKSSLGLSSSDKVLFIDPHYDDTAFGAALFAQACALEEIDTKVVVVTDGSMGYGPGQDASSIVEIRKQESEHAYSIIGLSPKNIIHLNYPDLGLHQYQGRRPADPKKDANIIMGHTGLRNSLVHYLREYNPTVVVIPTANDLHIDHRITYQEAIYAIHSACGNKWPELGEPMSARPRVFEMSVSRGFDDPPSLAISSQRGAERKKLSVMSFRSQVEVVDDLVLRLDTEGPYEFLHEIFPFSNFGFHEEYRNIFFSDVEAQTVEPANDFSVFLNKARQLLGEHVLTTEEAKIKLLGELADEVLNFDSSLEFLNDFHFNTCSANSQELASIRLLSKVALSRGIVLDIASKYPQAVTLNIAVAMYKEHNRILTSSEHENGENFLRIKIEQLNWLLRGTNITYKLFFVDDGCPNNSGGIAESIIANDNIANTRVLFLNDIIGSEHSAAKGLETTDDSKKGGSIQYGLQTALTESDPESCNLFLYTDSDLTVDLRIIGLLLHPIFNNGAQVSAGSKYSPLSYMDTVGTVGMNTPEMATFIAFRKLIRDNFFNLLSEVPDIHCGFKAFTREAIEVGLDGMKEKKFSFDLELLLKIILDNPGDANLIQNVPIMITDSIAESTSRGNDIHLSGLKQMSKIYLDYYHMLPADLQRESSRELAQRICGLSVGSYSRLIEVILPHRNSLKLDPVLYAMQNI